MTIALIGAHGQLGSDLQEQIARNTVTLGHAEIEIADFPQVERVLDKLKPRFVINAAAYNQVDRAEEEPKIAYAVNALGPRNLAQYCGARDIPLLHVSTDFVFGLDRDRSRPYEETDVPGPLGAYAVSKLAGEHFVRSLCPKHFVVRSCGLYGHRAVHGNFVETMLRLAAERPEIRVVNDQKCTPTASRDLAIVVSRLIATEAYGLYHATSSGGCTWFEFASAIFELAELDTKVAPVTSEGFGAKAKRPSYSVLDCSKLIGVLGDELPHWREALAKYLSERATIESTKQ